MNRKDRSADWTSYKKGGVVFVVGVLPLPEEAEVSFEAVPWFRHDVAIFRVKLTQPLDDTLPRREVSFPITGEGVTERVLLRFEDDSTALIDRLAKPAHVAVD